MSEVHGKIQKMIDAGILHQVIMVDTEGMIIDSIGDAYHSENLASLFFPSHTFMETVREDLGIPEIEELAVYAEKKKQRIILRHLPVDEMHFYLIAVCPSTAPQQKVVSAIIRIFYSRIMGVPEEDVPESMIGPPVGEEPAFQPEKRREAEDIVSVEATEKTGPEVAARSPIVTPELKAFFGKLTEEIKKADLVVGDKPASEISDEAIDLISYKLLKNLSSNVIEKMLHKVFLQITDGLIRQEISVLRKDLDTLFKP